MLNSQYFGRRALIYIIIALWLMVLAPTANHLWYVPDIWGAQTWLPPAMGGAFVMALIGYFDNERTCKRLCMVEKATAKQAVVLHDN